MPDKLIIRRASTADAESMAAMLNRIIADGGWTSMTDRVFPAEQARFIRDFPANGVFNVALLPSGFLAGSQDVIPGGMPGVGDISTFVDLGYLHQGVGSRLWAQTLVEARELKITRIRAIIRNDNMAGQNFYRSLGFAQIGILDPAPGQSIKRVLTEISLSAHPDM